MDEEYGRQRDSDRKRERKGDSEREFLRVGEKEREGYVCGFWVVLARAFVYCEKFSTVEARGRYMHSSQRFKVEEMVSVHKMSNAF